MILNNKKSTFCKYLSNSLIFDCENNVKLCPYSDFADVINNFNGIWLDIDKIISSKNILLNSPRELCKDCIFFSPSNKNLKEFEEIYLLNWHYCYVNCKYCNMPKEEDLIKANHYDILPSIKNLLDKKLINKKTKIIFGCGDATVHPEFDKILYFLINYGFENIIVNTPALRYCESISEAISKNIIQVIVPFDTGCPYIYEKIKGINKYDIAINTIKRYLSFQELNQKRVILKYTIIQGINDNQKEILDWYILSRDLGVKKLLLDIDYNFLINIKNSIPEYIKELIIFAENMSKYNNLEIEFSPKIDIIYKIIRNKR